MNAYKYICDRPEHLTILVHATAMFSRCFNTPEHFNLNAARHNNVYQVLRFTKTF